MRTVNVVRWASVVWSFGAGCGNSTAQRSGTGSLGAAGTGLASAGIGAGFAGTSAFPVAGNAGGVAGVSGLATAGTSGLPVAGDSGAFAGSGGFAGDSGGAGTGAAGFGAAGTGAAGTGAAGTGAAGTGGGGSDVPTKLPSATSCPTMTNGGTAKFGRMNVITYIDPAAKSKPAPGGPLILYYHATGGAPSEVLNGFGQANIAKVTAAGGVVASFTTTACSGCSTTDDAVWYVEDGPIQDQVVACAIQQANIDTRHIHALGWSAGALHSTWVGINRNNYMASIISYSGGMPPWPGQSTPQDPNNHVSAIMTYGAADAVVVDFPTQSKAYYNNFSPKGWYTMMCFTGGGHMIDTKVAPVSLQFFMDHPFNTSPEPYKDMIPAAFPSYCKNTIP